jgi:Leucine carboxyl methyltransferase
LRAGEPSKTARGAAAYRAIHQTLEEGSIFRDPIASRILDDETLANLDQIAADPSQRPMRLFVAARSRFSEDVLSANVARGVRQIVVLGAGLDTFSLRNPHAGEGVRVFEVDYRATQDWKRERLKQAGLAMPASLTFAPVDFERQSPRPDIVIHQLTDLPSAPGTPGYPAAQEANRRLRIEGTRNLIQAAGVAGVRRAIAQSIAFVYAPGESARTENDSLDLTAEGVRQLTVQGIVALEHETLHTPGIEGVVLRYGYLYGPDTWYPTPPKPPSVHVDAAALAALLAVSKGAGVYNIAEEDGAVSSAKARRELGFDSEFRIP